MFKNNATFGQGTSCDSIITIYLQIGLSKQFNVTFTAHYSVYTKVHLYMYNNLTREPLNFYTFITRFHTAHATSKTRII